MGCGNSKDTNDNSPSLRNQIFEDVYSQIQKHPLYTFSFDKMQALIISNYRSKHSDSLSKLIELLGQQTKMNELSLALLTDVLNVSEEKFTTIFPKASDDSVSKYHNNLISLLYFYLTKSSLEISAHKQELIHFLVSSSIKNATKSEYYSGKLSYLLFNLLSFVTFAFVYLFAAPTILRVIGGVPNDGLSNIFIHKKSWDQFQPKEVNDYINEKLIMINTKIKYKHIISRLLAECLQPISQIVIRNPDAESVVLSEEQVDNIVNVVSDVINVEGFCSNFFYGDAKKFI